MSLVRIKQRTIVVYLDEKGRQRATPPWCDEDVRLLTEGKNGVKPLYLVRCRPRRRT